MNKRRVRRIDGVHSIKRFMPFSSHSVADLIVEYESVL